jgi:prefoldin subunit 5
MANITPEASEVAELNSVVEALTGQVGLLNTSIARLRHRLTASETRIATLERENADVRALLEDSVTVPAPADGALNAALDGGSSEELLGPITLR